jgi:hypothetical protein
MNLDLNNAEFAQKDVTIFNNGEASNNSPCTIKVVKNDPVEGKNVPMYDVVCTSANGGTVKLSFWQFKDTDTPDQIKKTGARLRHLFEAVIGTSVLPAGEANSVLTQVMKAVNEAAKGKNFKVATNYGTIGKASKYLSVRTWAPFIAKAEDKDIPNSNIEVMVRPEPDNDSSGSGYSPGSQMSDIAPGDSSDWPDTPSNPDF